MSDDTADSLISQGLELMLYGMGTVILFLGLLVLAITLMSWLLRRFFPEPVPPAEVAAVPDPRVPVAIAAAIRSHRSRH